MAYVTNIDHRGIDTNAERGLIYSEFSCESASCIYVDTGSVYDGDVDCASPADSEGNETDGDHTSVTRGLDSVVCGKSVNLETALIATRNSGPLTVTKE